MAKKQFKTLSLTSILEYGFPEPSFKTGIEENPHLTAVDAGTTHPRPYY